MSEHQRVIITGFMGSGKTTLAQELAKRLNWPARDLDQIITELEQQTPREIIEAGGESAFRDVETRALREVLRSDSSFVLALGGGAWALERNRDLIEHDGGLTVWLDAPFELCWERIAASGGQRPLAKNKGTALDLYNLRRPAYGLTRLHVNVVAGKSLDDLVQEIIQAICD